MTVRTHRHPGDYSARWLYQQRARWPLDPDLPRVAVLIIGDGRDAIRDQTLRSFVRQVHGYTLAEVIEVDDRRHALGFCGAIQAGWRELVERERWNRSCGGDGGWEYVFHVEEDWLFNRDVDVRSMASVLDAAPLVAQVCLRRNAVNDAERAAGGLIEMWPDEYAECWLDDAPLPGEHVHWLEHSLWFSTNPCLYRQSLLAEFAWPDGPRCEEAFSTTLAVEGRRFAYLGQRDDAPWITHNAPRTGRGY